VTTQLMVQPLMSTWLLAAALVPALLLLAIAALRRARGWSLRALALLALALALLDPRVIREQRNPRTDVAIVVIDDSPSQKIGDRPLVTERSVAALTAQLSDMDGIEVRTLHASGDATGDTRLFDAIERGVLNDTAGRLAGVFVISDGQVHDVPASGTAAWLNAPVHLLLTGRRDERDRRVIVEQAPAYGLVDDSVDVVYRVDEMGPKQATEGSNMARVRFRIDGQHAGETTAGIGAPGTFSLPIRHAGPTVLEVEVEPGRDEISTANNRTAVVVNGVRERLRVLLVSGQPHPGERTWRNLLKSDPSVDLVHFTILRPPEKDDATPLKELSLIVFPVQELFENKLKEFDLVVFDRYVVRGILPAPYYTHIADYVRSGGALLLAAGPEFATAQSLFRTTLGDVLPIRPRDRIIEKAFRAQITDAGHRHPITAELPGERVAGDADPEQEASGSDWGRWFRQVDGQAVSGTTLMTGADNRPLLTVDRVGEGRVAQLMSDHIWLWARGYDGGGPHAELLRRLAHWLMKEPELEEESLQAEVSNQRLQIRRRSLASEPVDVTITDPAGETRSMTLAPGADGISRAELPASITGLWQVSDGQHTALAAAGRLDTPELADLRTTPERMAPIVQSTGGGIVYLTDGNPDLRSTAPGRDAAGRGWLGIRRNHATEVTAVTEVPLAPALIVIFATLGMLAGAWWREGR
jgi:hypothetical protein